MKFNRIIKGSNNREFWQSALKNNGSFVTYYNRLVELSVSMFKWNNLPDTIDPRYLELALYSDGHVVFFEDEELGHLALRCAVGGGFNVYNVPISRNVITSNGYHRRLNINDSVLIYNNFLRHPSMLTVQEFANRLYELDRTIDVNVNAQKTPIMIVTSEKQRLTMQNVYMKYEGNQPVIFANDNLNPDSLKVLQTGAPFVADKLYQLKTQIWNEALTYLGITNLNINKRERLISDEVARYQGGTIACRMSRLKARQQAADQINKMFGLNISVEYDESVEGSAAETAADLKQEVIIDE